MTLINIVSINLKKQIPHDKKNTFLPDHIFTWLIHLI